MLHVSNSCSCANCLSCVQVPSHLLAPNLHIAVCRYLAQELLRGPIAGEAEWWLERAMNTAKPSRRMLHAEKTMVKGTQTMDRALSRNRVYHSCRPAEEMRSEMRLEAQPARSTELVDPAAAAGKGTFFRFSGTLFIGTTASMPAVGGSSMEVFVQLLSVAVRSARTASLIGWQGVHLVDAVGGQLMSSLLTHVRVLCFTECHLPHMSACSVQKGASSKVQASTWVEGQMFGPRGGRRLELWQVQSFVLLSVRADACEPLRLAIVRQNEDWVRGSRVGGLFYTYRIKCKASSAIFTSRYENCTSLFDGAPAARQRDVTARFVREKCHSFAVRQDGPR